MIEDGPSNMPAAALYPASALGLMALVYALTRTRHVSGQFLIAIIWLRYMMQVFHEVTHPPFFAGFSLNALASLAVCIAGAFVVKNRLRVLARLPVMLLLMGVIIISGLLNGLYAGMIETLLKWGYFFVVLLCLYDCMRRDGDARILTPLMWVFAPLLLLQALSIALGTGKASEGDGSVSFIGGFSHEAAFSIVLVTCFAVASFAPRLHPALRVGLLTACVIGVFAANYRTSLIALAPLAIGYVTFSTARSFTSRQRLFVSAATLLGALSVTILAAWLLRERMADIATAANDNVFFKPPADFNQSERALFSGRIYLWSSYLDAYLAGDDLRILFGFGPDAWIGVFAKYAHNTVISYLYEFGAFGAALIVLIWLSMLARVRAIPDPWLRGQLFFAHLGFIILNQATMPFWQIEGLILYGLLCGYTLALTSRRPLQRTYARAIATPALPQLVRRTSSRGEA
jgi:hypothetical protein